MTMEPEDCPNRAVMAIAPQNVSLAPPPPVVGQHHSREEGCVLETLSSCGNVDNINDGGNDNGRF
jgi:hypothetical protein